MAKFRFYQDKEIKAWIRDYFTVEADNLEDAIALIKNDGRDLDIMESRHNGRVVFEERDMDTSLEWFTNGSFGEIPIRYSIFSCDLECEGYDGEIVRKVE
jgi:hypothetical protein